MWISETGKLRGYCGNGSMLMLNSSFWLALVHTVSSVSLAKLALTEAIKCLSNVSGREADIGCLED